MAHYGSSNIDNLYSHLKKIQRDFDWCNWWFNKTFLYCKSKNYQFLIQNKIKSYHWSKEYCKLHPLVVHTTWDQMVASNIIHCFSSDDNNDYTSFSYQFQTMLVYCLKANHPHIKKLIYFSDSCGGQFKNYKNFMDLSSIKKTFYFIKWMPY